MARKKNRTKVSIEPKPISVEEFLIQRREFLEGMLRERQETLERIKIEINQIIGAITEIDNMQRNMVKTTKSENKNDLNKK